jgi:hypothetical protein
MFPANLNSELADLVKSPFDNKVEIDHFGFTIENHKLRLTYRREHGVYHEVNLSILIEPVIYIEGSIKLDKRRISDVCAYKISALTKDPESEEPSFIIAETTLEEETELTIEDFCGCKEEFEFIKNLKAHSSESRKDITVEPRQEWFSYANQVLGNSLEKLDFINVYFKWETEFRKKKEAKNFWEYFGIKALKEYLKSKPLTYYIKLR